MSCEIHEVVIPVDIKKLLPDTRKSVDRAAPVRICHEFAFDRSVPDDGWNVNGIRFTQRSKAFVDRIKAKLIFFFRFDLGLHNKDFSTRQLQLSFRPPISCLA